MSHVGLGEDVGAELGRLHRRGVEVLGPAADHPLFVQYRLGRDRLRVLAEAHEAHDHLD